MFDLEVELLSEFGPVSSLFKQQILCPLKFHEHRVSKHFCTR